MLLLLILKSQHAFLNPHVGALMAVYHIKQWTMCAHSSYYASVFTEVACVTLTNGICSSCLQDSANQSHPFSIFSSIYWHCGQILKLVGSCLQTNTCTLVSEGKKAFCTRRSLCNRQQGDQWNESWSYCLQSNSSASERKQRNGVCCCVPGFQGA